MISGCFGGARKCQTRYFMTLNADLDMDRTSYFELSRFEFHKYV